MPLLVVTCLLLTVIFSSCTAKRLQTIEPLYGVDVTKANRTLGGFIALNEDVTSYDGYFFSKEYVNAYLIDKCQAEGKC